MSVQSGTQARRVWLRGLPARIWLLVMIGLQLVWIAGIWLTGAAVRADKLLPLAVYTLLTGTAVFLLSPWLRQRLQNITRLALGHPHHTLAFLCLAVLLVGTLYAARQRVWAFDEEGNVAAATIVAEQGVPELFANYGKRPWLGRQHPPLVPILYGLVLRLVGTDLLVARLVSLVFTLGVGLLTWRMGIHLYDQQTGLLGFALLFAMPLVWRLGTAAMVEMPLTFFFTLTLYLTLRLIATPRRWLPPVVGAVAGAGLLSKYTMVFVFPIMTGWFVLSGELRRMVRHFGLLVLCGVVLFAGWVLLAADLGVWQTQLKTVLTYAGLVLTNDYGRKVLFETVTNRLPSSLGVYNVPLMLLGLTVLWQTRTRSDKFLLIWIVSIWLPLLFTLPDHRYFLPSFPAVVLLMARGVMTLRSWRETAVLWCWLSCGGALYLFIDWVRAAELFVR